MTRLLATHDAIRHELDSRSQPEGGLLGVFLDATGRIVLCVEIGEGTRDVDELFLRHVISIVEDIDVAAVVFAVSRRLGRPTRVDKLLWRELAERVTTTSSRLLDVVVVGEHQMWSAATGRRWDVQRHPSLAGFDVEDHPVRGDVGEVRLVRHQQPPTEELHAGRGVPGDR
jgi:hypothetical protein